MRRRFLLLLLITAAVLYWRPTWRAALIGSARQAARSGWTRADAWARARLGLAPAPVPPPKVALSPPVPDALETPSAPERPEPKPVQEKIGPSGNLPPQLPKVAAQADLPAALRALRAAVGRPRDASAYRKLADAAAAAGFPQVAAEAYLAESKIYRAAGDPDAATVEELKAGQYRTEGILYLHSRSKPGIADTGARLEPAYGALLGAFIDRDDQLPTTFMDENWQTHREPSEFSDSTGRKHASLFCYLRYGQRFPAQWAERLSGAGVIPHIAWEPKSLAEVDEAGIRQFAEGAARFGAPLFVRFAGEMNGDWTPYHGDPALYREKFRLVHRVMSATAPNAALIWCPNDLPDREIDAYYPGDDAVDWVGVNLYNTPFENNDPAKPSTCIHPVDLLRPVYERYSARKPIAICEYAASHEAAVDHRQRPEFAASRMAELYGALPRLFPRVKLIDWFDCNNLRHAPEARQLNDYSLTDCAPVLAAYREAVAPDYFLSALGESPELSIRRLKEADGLSGVVTLSAWVRASEEGARVFLVGDSRVLFAGDRPGPAVCRWDTHGLPPGNHSLRLLVLGRGNRVLLDHSMRVRVVH